MDGIGNKSNPYYSSSLDIQKADLQGISSQKGMEGGESSDVVFKAENGDIQKGSFTGEFNNDRLAKMNVNGEEVLANPTSVLGVGDEIDLGGNMRGEITGCTVPLSSEQVFSYFFP